MLSSRGFEQSGIYVMRHADLYMIVDCGRNGLNDWGGHAHNDTLSFELSMGQTGFLVDPGSYAYTFSRQWHELFRSTAYHNTVRVDGQEINRFQAHDFWGLQNDAVPQVNYWQTTRAYDLLDAQHTGYMRLRSPIVHRRQILFHKEQPFYWVIRDTLVGAGRHAFEAFFHVGDAMVSRASSSIAELKSQRATDDSLFILPRSMDDLGATVENAWRSTAFGQKQKSSILRYSGIASAPIEFVTVLWPHRTSGSPSQILEQAWSAVELALGQLVSLPLTDGHVNL